MKDDATRYPLSWPVGWRRTEIRREARFFATMTGNDGMQRWKGGKVTIAQAIDRLEKQLRLLRAGEDPVLSTNVKTGMRGDPISSRGEPKDPGAAVYFQLGGKDRVLACDTWLRTADNIAAIAAHIDAMRRIERYAVGSLDQAFAGYDALPAPGADNRPPWRNVLGIKPDSVVTLDDVTLIYRTLAKRAATDEQWLMSLNLAREEAKRELGGATP